MKAAIAWIVAAITLAATGCMGERTKNMAQTCQALLEQGGQPNARTFIDDAERQLAVLGKAHGKVATYLRDLQDPEAMTHKAALEQCLWLLKSRQG